MRISLTILFLAITSVFSHTVFAVTDSVNVNLEVNGGGGGPEPSDDLSISNIESDPETISVLITWDTNLDAISTISWGLTNSYELGSYTETVGTETHAYEIESLTPGTLYYFKIEAHEDGEISNSDEVINQQFTTDALDLVPTTPLNFQATYDADEGDIDLDWQNPGDADFDRVILRRSTLFYPATENDGELIYEGSSESFEDVDVVSGTRYYYSLFARDDAGQYSAPAIDDATVPEDIVVPPILPECEPGEDCDEPDPPNDDDDPAGEPDPFENLPLAPDVPPEIRALSFLSFDFWQFDKKILYKNFSVPVDGDADLTISVDYRKLPEVLKTIGITIKDPKTKESFSFLLRGDEGFDTYRAFLGAFPYDGDFPISITFLDHKNQVLRRFNGTLLVRGSQLLNNPTIQELEGYAPYGQAIGVAAGLTQTLLVASNVRSLYDLYLVIIRLFAALFGILGIRRQSKPWGTVYDSVTKRPLDPAYVTVLNNSNEVADAITDLDGRYGFLLPEGVYHVKAGKTHYQFPSKILSGHSRDELYNNLYFGEPLATREGEIINRNIPLDPIGFDWNEFVKNKQGLFRLYSRRDRIKGVIFSALYIFGFASTIFALIVSPSWWNAGMLFFYIGLWLFQAIWKYHHHAIRVRNAETDTVFPYSIVRVYSAALNEEIKNVVTDEFGRFFILVAPGRYYLTVDAKQPDGSYKKIYMSPVMELPKGVLRDDIEIGDKVEQGRGLFGIMQTS